MSVFLLFANVVPVKGAVRSTLCDLQRGRIKLIPNDLYDLLTNHKGQGIEAIKDRYPPADRTVIDDYYRFLIEEEWGFLCDEPEAFPDLDLSYDAPASITNAILDVAEGTEHDYRNLVAQLTGLGCWFLQVRAWCSLSLAHLERILEAARSSRLRSVEVFTRFDATQRQDDLAALVRAHPRVYRLVVHTSPEEREIHTREIGAMGKLVYLKAAMTSHHCCGVVDRAYFISELSVFAEALHFNSCLNRKISVDAEGMIRNCPSMSTTYGHASRTALAEVAGNPEFRQIWSVTKDQVAVCRDCEFRYVCTDCRAHTRDGDPLGKPAKCCYDPYTASWQSVDPAVLSV